MTKRTHEQLKKTALSKPEVKKEYDLLAAEFDLLKEMVKIRIKSGKTQQDVAKAMKTSTSVVGRLETGGGANKHSPTVETLRKYANALGYNLKIRFVHQRPHS